MPKKRRKQAKIQQKPGKMYKNRGGLIGLENTPQAAPFNFSTRQPINLPTVNIYPLCRILSLLS